MRKKLLLTLMACALIGLSASAQQPTFLKGDNVANVGVGFLGSYYGIGAWGGGTKLPLLSVSFEHCIIDNLFNEKSSLGVGGFIGYTHYKYSDWRLSYIPVGAKGALHYALVDNLDTYAGAFMGYVICNSNDNFVNPSGRFSSTVFAGARYYFNDAIAAFGEVNLGYSALSLVNLGISFKF